MYLLGANGFEASLLTTPPALGDAHETAYNALVAKDQSLIPNSSATFATIQIDPPSNAPPLINNLSGNIVRPTSITIGGIVATWDTGDISNANVTTSAARIDENGDLDPFSVVAEFTGASSLTSGQLYDIVVVFLGAGGSRTYMQHSSIKLRRNSLHQFLSGSLSTSGKVYYLMNSRRSFLTQSTAVSITAAFSIGKSLGQDSPKKRFSMQFAPHPRTFRAHAGKNIFDQIRFAHDQGFSAWEDNRIALETPQMQEKIGGLLADLNMEMGVFVGYKSFDRPTFTVKNKKFRDEVLAEITSSIEVAERCGATFFTVVPGSVDQQYTDQAEWKKGGGPRLSQGYQTANVIDLLRECTALLEPKKITMVLEPLNWHENHGGVFLEHSDQAYAICRAVNSPSCKILFDIYHQQISEGNLIPNIDLSWDEIAYFQAGDNPGRKEPGTGEINYSNIFAHIKKKAAETNRQFIIGMEHGNSMKGKKGELALIEAYRKVDPS